MIHVNIRPKKPRKSSAECYWPKRYAMEEEFDTICRSVGYDIPKDVVSEVCDFWADLENPNTKEDWRKFATKHTYYTLGGLTFSPKFSSILMAFSSLFAVLSVAESWFLPHVLMSAFLSVTFYFGVVVWVVFCGLRKGKYKRLVQWFIPSGVCVFSLGVFIYSSIHEENLTLIRYTVAGVNVLSMALLLFVLRVPRKLIFLIRNNGMCLIQELHTPLGSNKSQKKYSVLNVTQIDKVLYRWKDEQNRTRQTRLLGVLLNRHFYYFQYSSQVLKQLKKVRWGYWIDWDEVKERETKRFPWPVCEIDFIG